MNKFLTLCILALTLSGCAAFQGQGPDAPDQTVIFAGDLGLACAAIPADNAAEATRAIQCANSVFKPEGVDVAAFAACAAAQGLDERYSGLVTLVIDRVRARFGGSATFPIDSTASEALRAFVATCSVAIGVVQH